MTRYTPCQPFVEILVYVKGAGSGLESKIGVPKGTAHHLEHMMARVSQKYGWDEVRAYAAYKGGVWTAATGLNGMTFQILIAAEKWRQGVDRIADSVCRPRFDHDRRQEENRTISGERVSRIRTKPGSTFTDWVVSSLFQGNDYYQNSLGTKETIASILPNHMQAHHNAFFLQDRTKIAVQGNVRHSDVVLAFHDAGFALARETPDSIGLDTGARLLNGDYRRERLPEGTTSAVVFPLAETMGFEEGVQFTFFNQMLNKEMYWAVQAASGSYDCSSGVTVLPDASYLCLSFTSDPVLVGPALGAMRSVLSRAATDKNPLRFDEHRITERSGWKNKALPYWLNMEDLMSNWAQYQSMPALRAVHDIRMAMTPTDVNRMVRQILSGSYSFFAEGEDLAGLPDPQQVGHLLGMKPPVCVQPPKC
ncbi:MAG: M16 family metallopeptidase [Bdellovibrionales bacterium]